MKRKYNMMVSTAGWYIAGAYLLYAPPPSKKVRWGYLMTSTGCIKKERLYPYSLARGEFLPPKPYANVRQGIYDRHYVMISSETPPPGCEDV